VEKKIKRPAPLPMILMDRHPLMNGKRTKVYAKENKRYQRAKKLGLVNQMKASVETVYNDDMNRLTKKKGYKRVTEEVLMQLFEIPRLKRLALKRTLQNIWASNLKYCIMACLFSTAYWVITNPIYDSSSVWFLPAIIFGAIATGLSLGSFILLRNGQRGWEFPVAKVALATANLDETSIRIPDRAMAAYEKAKGTGIFKDFKLRFPTTKIEKVSVNIIPELDPAIVGLTGTGKMYMICYWDIKQDIDIAEARINELKPFKIEEE